MVTSRPPARRAGRAVVSAVLFSSLASIPIQSAPPISLDSVPTLVFFTPISVEWDPRDQTLWVADQYLPRIAHIDKDGAPISTFSALLLETLSSEGRAPISTSACWTI